MIIDDLQENAIDINVRPRVVHHQPCEHVGPQRRPRDLSPQTMVLYFVQKSYVCMEHHNKSVQTECDSC